MRRAIVRAPNAVRLEQFILSFTTRRKEKKLSANIEERTAISKAAWFGLAGISAQEHG